MSVDVALLALLAVAFPHPLPLGAVFFGEDLPLASIVREAIQAIQAAPDFHRDDFRLLIHGSAPRGTGNRHGPGVQPVARDREAEGVDDEQADVDGDEHSISPGR